MPRTQMRVLIATTVPHLPDLVGGTQLTLSALARHLSAEKTPTAILGRASLFPAATGDPQWTSDLGSGVQTYRANDPIAAFDSVLSDWRPDALIVHFDRAAYRLAMLAMERQLPVVLHLDSAFIERPEPQPIDGSRLRFAAISPFVARRAKTLFGIDAVVLPPIIEHRPGPSRNDGDAVLMVNPTVLKGVEIFLGLAAARPKIRFIAVESWDLSIDWRQVLLARAMALGNVELWPAMGDIGEALAEARLVLAPSIHEETWGRIVTEAQAWGIPAIVSDRGALPETAGPGGLVVPLDSGTAKWEMALDLVWTSADLYTKLSKLSRLHAARPELASKAVADSYLALLGAPLGTTDHA